MDTSDLFNVPSAWTANKNFAIWLVNTFSPNVIVDLGVDYGYSSYAFALPNIGTVYSVDSFTGDNHAGTRNTYELVNSKIKKFNLTNIRLIKNTFDEAAKSWVLPIDILHIDGYHTYEAVSNDYKTWSNFVPFDGIILLHDTCVEDPTFGVNKLFLEIDLPKYNFTTWPGLGIISKNSDIIAKVKNYFNNGSS